MCFRQQAGSAAGFVAAARFFLGTGAHFCLHGQHVFFQPVGLFARSFCFGCQIAQAILFSKAARSRRWRFGCGDEPVPAPQIAFLGDEPLAGLEQFLQLRAFAAHDNTDVAQAPRQSRRSLHHVGQAVYAGRQGRVVCTIACASPMGRSGGIGGGFQVIANGCAERSFIALFNLQFFHDRRPQIALAD